jgi:hypothetical protein
MSMQQGVLRRERLQIQLQASRRLLRVPEILEQQACAASPSASAPSRMTLNSSRKVNRQEVPAR